MTAAAIETPAVDGSGENRLGGEATTKEVLEKKNDATASSSSVTVSCSSSSSAGSDSEEGEEEYDNNDHNVVVGGDPSFPMGLKRRRNNGNNNKDENENENAFVATDKATATTTTAVDIRQQLQRKKDADTAFVDKPFTPARWAEFFVGSAIFFSAVPLVVAQIVSCTLWEFADQATLRLTVWGTRFNQAVDPYLKRFVSHPKDTFVVGTTFWLGFVLPAYFFFEAKAQRESLLETGKFVWWRAALYNVIRIGPMYRHFMYVYVLCHKEAHCNGKLFSKPYRSVLGLGNIYNYFIGFFHGVLPGPFTESHIYNHHKYDNSKLDVYSTGAYRRDSFGQYLRYVYVWFLYALNVSSAIQFFKEGKTSRTIRSVLGTLYFGFGVFLCGHFVDWKFAMLYVVYPLVEGNILLSAVNYTWHAFIDPNDHDNDYVNSVTILDGLNFTLDEEYHVVHHQYGGVHWSRNSELYHKHIEEYKKCTATIFQGCNLFVIWGMIVAKDYEGLTTHFVQLEEDESKRLSKKELAQLLKERLQCTSWSY